MNHNSNLIARLMIAELPGLVGAMQQASPGGQARARGLSDMALRQHRRNLGNAMLVAASRLLAPASKGNPAGSLQRLGAGLGAVMQGQGAMEPGILDALGDGRQSRGAGSMVNRSAAQGKTGPASAPGPATAESSNSRAAARNAEGRASGGANSGRERKSARGATLYKFSGTVARRLEYPAVLSGGWQLYGYDKKSGKPVYVGPNQELRIYR
jgi:hypothetical protein